ncbi:hypothetical protein OAT77_07855 [Alphaproteobacteria bacterium]|nr:hypothetical protein [Alphaproteobacteria bacterium]
MSFSPPNILRENKKGNNNKTYPFFANAKNTATKLVAATPHHLTPAKVAKTPHSLFPTSE